VSRRSLATSLALVGVAALGGLTASSASAVPISVPHITINDGYTVRAEGTIWSPAAARSCVAVVRAQLQVLTSYGYHVVRALGSHRIDVCDGDDEGDTSSGLYVQFPGMQHLRSQPARICWAATQQINGRPSRNISCKRFSLRGGS
jgi:hypothetical protein